MITLITGRKGSGKTKELLDLVNVAAEQSNGNVVCVEKGDTLKFSLTHKVRLIDADHYEISGFDAYYGMLCGICAGNYDVTHIFGDATLRIGSRDVKELEAFLGKIKALSEESNVNFVFTISAQREDLPAGVLAFAN